MSGRKTAGRQAGLWDFAGYKYRLWLLFGMSEHSGALGWEVKFFKDLTPVEQEAVIVNAVRYNPKRFTPRYFRHRPAVGDSGSSAPEANIQSFLLEGERLIGFALHSDIRPDGSCELAFVWSRPSKSLVGKATAAEHLLSHLVNRGAKRFTTGDLTKTSERAVQRFIKRKLVRQLSESGRPVFEVSPSGVRKARFLHANPK